LKIENLKDFKALVKACRSLGVDAIKVDGLEIALGKEPVKRSNKVVDEAVFPEASIQVPRFTGEITEPEKPATDEMTAEQLLMWSAQSHEEIQQ
jgi:hypothetical protein